ncbi:MAG: hypothetical protein ABI851_16545 [Saprospiraceae bacterium]
MKILFHLFPFLLIFNLKGQDSTKGNWIVSINMGIQEDDKRLFDFSGRNNLLETQPGFLGTYQLGLSFAYLQKLKAGYELSYGIGLSSELNTFRRPYNQNYRKTSGNDALRYTDRYYKLLLSNPIKIKYRKTNRVGFLVELIPQFNLLTKAHNSRDDYSEKNYWFGIDIYSIELNPGFSINLGGSQLEIKYRLFQIKKIDRIIFNYLIQDKRNSNYETYNPIKLWITLNI